MTDTDVETPEAGGLSPSHADLLFAMLFKDRSEDPAETEAETARRRGVGRSRRFTSPHFIP